MNVKQFALLGSAISALAATPAFSQDEPAPVQAATQGNADETPAPESTDARDIIVNGRLTFRNRTTDVNPVLSYDLEYFQRFEPVSVGDMMRRVPGVTFTSDVLEYDGVQMRGLPPGFTSVLINGRRAPGGEADGSFFVDRIPAELIERIEIVRAPRADQPSDGIAGVLNVITKEGATFQGGSLRAGALINQDGGVRPSAAAAYAGTFGQTSYWVGLNYQERRNPKRKVSLRFGDITSDNAGIDDPEFDNIELQSDTRDGRDISGNFEISTPIGAGGLLRFNGLFVDTDRDEDETSITYEGIDLDLDEVEIQRERISQQTYGLGLDGRLPLAGGEVGFAAGWNAFREDTDTQTDSGDTLADAELDEGELLDTSDNEYTGTLSYTFGSPSARFKFGVDLLRHERDGTLDAFDFDGDDIDPDSLISNNFAIRENRYSPYARMTLTPTQGVTVDAGLRYEITRRTVTGRYINVDEDIDETSRQSYNAETVNPSLHVRYAPTAVDQFRFSVARTVRRPDYDLISPITLIEEPGDDDTTTGNAALRNQTAWGVDVGYERRLPGNGIFGVNFFYRDIRNLIELVAIADNGDGSDYTPRNIGDGSVWGVEFDLSTPLGFIGLPDTGFFANYTWLDSETTDPATGQSRRFNNQPHHVYNVGFIQNLRSINSSFGASISGRSTAVESNFDEIVRLRYTPDLEAFVEHRIGRNFVLRLSAQNLLNRSKREYFVKYDGDSQQQVLDNRAAGIVDEFEIERERSGRLFQVTARFAF
jgi:outer membrane receptor protein involved in Fe transport